MLEGSVVPQHGAREAFLLKLLADYLQVATRLLRLFQLLQQSGKTYSKTMNLRSSGFPEGLKILRMAQVCSISD